MRRPRWVVRRGRAAPRRVGSSRRRRPASARWTDARRRGSDCGDPRRRRARRRCSPPIPADQRATPLEIVRTALPGADRDPARGRRPRGRPRSVRRAGLARGSLRPRAPDARRPRRPGPRRRSTWPGAWPRRRSCGPGRPGTRPDRAFAAPTAGRISAQAGPRCGADSSHGAATGGRPIDTMGTASSPARQGTATTAAERARARDRRSITSTRSPTSTCSRCPRRSACSAAPPPTGIVWVNRRFVEILGLARGPDRSGSDWLRACIRWTASASTRPAATSTRDPRELGLQFRIIRPDGKRPARARARPPRSGDRGGAARLRRRDGGRHRPGRRRAEPPALPTTRSDSSSSRRRSASATRTSSGRIVYVNDRWWRSRRPAPTTSSAPTTSGSPIRTTAIGIFESMSAAAAAGQEWFGEMRVLRPDGEHPAHAHEPRDDPEPRRDRHRLRRHARGRHRRGRAPVSRSSARLQARAAAEAPRRRDVAHARDRVRRRRRRAGHRVLERLAPLRRSRLRRAGRPRQRARTRSGPQHAWHDPGGDAPEWGTDDDWLTGTEEAIGSVTLSWRTEPADAARRRTGSRSAVVGDALISTLARVRAERGGARSARSGSVRWPSTRPTSCSSTARPATSST